MGTPRTDFQVSAEAVRVLPESINGVHATLLIQILDVFFLCGEVLRFVEQAILVTPAPHERFLAKSVVREFLILSLPNTQALPCTLRPKSRGPVTFWNRAMLPPLDF